jgi:hypothetical protein
VSQKARQRIREKAKSLVEKQKRLAKRMVKSQRSVEGIEVAEVPGNDLQQNEIVQVDQQIEQSIQASQLGRYDRNLEEFFNFGRFTLNLFRLDPNTWKDYSIGTSRRQLF